MIFIRGKIKEYYALPQLDDDDFSFEISSDDNTSGQVISTILSQIFLGKGFFYKAYGLPTSIDEILESVKDLPYIYHEGDRSKFYMKRYPELVFETRDLSLIEKMLGSWSCATYEGRYIFITCPEHCETLKKFFETNLYKNEACLNEIWPFLLCCIESIPEASENDSFLITVRTSFIDEIKQIVSNQLFSL